MGVMFGIDSFARFRRRLLDLFYPPRCPFCRSLLKENEKTMCAKCRNDLPWTSGAAVSQGLPHIALCYSPLYYEGLVRASLLRYKFRGVYSYAENYSEILAKCIDENGVSCDSITWTPVGRKRLRERGYDQSRLLAEGVAALCGIECVPLLAKVRDNPPQSSIRSAEKRKRNVSGVYVLAPGADVRGRRILLVDDIVTTGATLSECVRVLKASGAAEVRALTLARGRR